jgi:sugar phosphate isomerase/epimerase
MKYSQFSLSLPQCTPAEAAKMIKEAGYDGVEWRCHAQPDPLPPIPNCWGGNRTTLDTKNWKKAVPEYRAIMSDHGLEFSNLASYCRADVPDDVKVCVEIAVALGCPRLRITAPPYNDKTNYHEVFKRAREAYTKAAHLCKAAGVQGLIELHMGNIVPSASLAFRLVDGLDAKHLGIMYDPGNMVIEGYENWKMGCELLGHYLAFCHAKNGRLRASDVTPSGAVKWSWEPCEMNTGFVDWVTVFKAFRSVGYDGWVSNEDFQQSTGNTLDRLRSGLQHLKRCEALAGK